jgi:predicted nucleic acid-binding protein
LSRQYLIDTGAWVAYLNRDDTHHAWASEVIDRIPVPLLTCEAVVSEACFLVRHDRAAILAMISRGVVKLSFALREQFPEVEALMAKYSDVPMALADACLVRMAELEPGAVVVTCDSDFQTYRKHRTRRIPLLMPE